MEKPVTLAPAVWAALEAVATTDDVSVGQIIRDAIQRELYRRTRAKKAVGPDERLVAPLRALLADDFAYARDWADLMARLRGKGFILTESGGGLIVLSAKTGEKLCKGSDLGYSHARLTSRLGCPFPAHRHGHVVVRHALAQPPNGPYPRA